jgi:glycosyltransferase involved in cell wall biosynthesis
MNVHQNLPKVLLAMPLPPPYSGIETSTEMLLASPLKERYRLVHFDTSNKVSNASRGRFDRHNVASSLKLLFKLLLVLARERPELAMMNMPANRNGFIKFASMVLPCVWRGSKVVGRISGGHFDKFYSREPRWFQAFVRFTLHRLHAVTVLADVLKCTLDSIVPSKKLWTVYNCLDPELFDGLPVTRQDDGKIRVLYVGHISKAKGALDLMAAIPLVLARHPQTHFQFAGDLLYRERNITFIDNPHDLEAAIYNLLKRNEIRESVELLGIIKGKEKLKTFVQADIFILPSYSEGFGFVILEAMLAGKAVVATPVGALPEVFEHERHLLYVQPGDVQGIAAAINRLIEDEPLRTSLGKAAREIVQKRFNLEQLAERMDLVLRNVLSDYGDVG